MYVYVTDRKKKKCEKVESTCSFRKRHIVICLIECAFNLMSTWNAVNEKVPDGLNVVLYILLFGCVVKSLTEKTND